MKQAWLGGALAACVILVTGCAQLPGFRPVSPPTRLSLPPPPEAFELECRVAIKRGEESFSGGMAWQHAAREETLLLRTPLGQGVAELHGTPSGVHLKDAEGREYQAEDAEALVRQVVGMILPIKGLSWWVVGQPRPGSEFQAEAGERGRLAVLRQDDWHIEFSRYATHADARRVEHILPGKLVARRGDDLEIRLVVDEWRLP